MSTAIECVHDVNFAIPYSTTTFTSSPFEPVHDLQHTHTHTEGSKLFVVYFIFLLGLVKSTKNAERRRDGSGSGQRKRSCGKMWSKQRHFMP